MGGTQGDMMGGDHQAVVGVWGQMGGSGGRWGDPGADGITSGWTGERNQWQMGAVGSASRGGPPPCATPLWDPRPPLGGRWGQGHPGVTAREGENPTGRAGTCSQPYADGSTSAPSPVPQFPLPKNPVGPEDRAVPCRDGGFHTAAR